MPVGFVFFGGVFWFFVLFFFMYWAINSTIGYRSYIIQMMKLYTSLSRLFGHYENWNKSLADRNFYQI